MSEPIACHACGMILCPECNKPMREVTEQYQHESVIGLVSVPNVTRLRCVCGEELFDMTACRLIDEAYKEYRKFNGCKSFRPLRKMDGSYSQRCADCGWMEQDH